MEGTHSRTARLKRRKGQGMTEYIIMVGLVAILMVGAITNFKNALNNAFEKGSEKIEEKVVQGMDGNSGSRTAPARRSM